MPKPRWISKKHKQGNYNLIKNTSFTCIFSNNSYLWVINSQDMEKVYYFKKEMQFRADQVANRLGTSRDVLVAILQGAGFKVSMTNDHLFSGEQIRAIAEAYVDSIRESFQNYKLRCRTGRKVDEHERNYFYQFVNHRLSYLRANEFADWVLDNELIEAAFYKLVSSTRTREDNGSAMFNAVLRFMSRQVKNYVRISQNILHTIIPPKLFFTYTDEEDSHSFAANNTGFAVAGN